MHNLSSSFRDALRPWHSLALLGIWTASGCSLMADADRVQCSTHKDCTDRGAAFAGSVCIDSYCQPDPKWACVDSPTKPEPQAEVSGVLEVGDLLTGAPAAGVHATLFRQFDFQFSQPLSSGDTGLDGRVTLLVPAEFVGFVFLEKYGAIAPTLVYLNTPVTAGAGLGKALVGTVDDSAGLVAMLGGVAQADRGIVLIQVLDCTGQGAAGYSQVSRESGRKHCLPYLRRGGVYHGASS